jgi:DNA-binding LacI/PurR family transcriptional regulator
MAEIEVSLSEIDLRRLMSSQQELARQDMQSWMCIHLMLDAGFSPIQVERLRHEDVDLTAGTLRVRPASESRGQIKTVILSQSLQDHLRQFVAWKRSIGQSTEDWDALIFGKRGPLSSAGIQQAFKRAVVRAGLDGSVNIQQARRLVPKSDRPVRRTIALMIPAAEPTAAFSPLIYEAWQGVEACLNDMGFDVVVGQTHRDRLELPGRLTKESIDGLIFTMSPVDARVLVQWADIPSVWMFTPSPGLLIWGDRVAPDNHGIGRMAAEYLHRRGHRRICYVTLENISGFHNGGLSTRRSVFKQMTEVLGGHCHVIVPPNVKDQEIDHTHVLDPTWLEHELDQVLAMSDMPSGWFLSHAPEYQFVCKYLKRHGIDPHRDVELVVCDNIPTIRELDNPPVAVDVRPGEMGRQAAELLLRRISGQAGEHSLAILIQPRLMQGIQPVLSD